MVGALLLNTWTSARALAPHGAGTGLRRPREDDKNDRMTRGRFAPTRHRTTGKRRRARAWSAPSRSCRAYVALIAASRRTTC
jgi:hypothetical protein